MSHPSEVGRTTGNTEPTSTCTESKTTPQREVVKLKGKAFQVNQKVDYCL